MLQLFRLFLELLFFAFIVVAVVYKIWLDTIFRWLIDNGHEKLAGFLTALFLIGCLIGGLKL